MFVIIATSYNDRKISFGFWCTLKDWSQVEHLALRNADEVWTSFRSMAAGMQYTERPTLPVSMWTPDRDPGAWTDNVMTRLNTKILEPSVEIQLLDSLILYTDREVTRNVFHLAMEMTYDESEAIRLNREQEVSGSFIKATQSLIDQLGG